MALGASSSDPPDSAVARRILAASWDRAAAMDAAGQLTMVQQSLTADPTYLQAHLAYLARFSVARDTRDEYRRLAEVRPTPLHRCLAAFAEAPQAYRAAAVPALEALERETGPEPCIVALLGLLSADFMPSTHARTEVLARERRAVQAFPDWASLRVRHARSLRAAERLDEARGVVRRGLARAEHTLERAALYDELEKTLRRDDPPRGAMLGLALAHAMERDGRPGILSALPVHLRWREPGRSGPGPEAIAREQVRLAEPHGDPAQRMGARSSLAAVVSDAGRPFEALAIVEPAIRLSDSLRWPAARAQLYWVRGRALLKLGRLDQAEHDLRLAVETAAESKDAYYLAEALHNLAHVYEGQGRLEDAARVADRFVAATRGMAGFQPRMMSLRDAGLIRWKLGWVAAAEAAFAEMVTVVDYQERFHYWAGEHFERVGDLDRAVEYYRRGVRRDPGEASLNLGGLARVFEVMGRPDSAAAAARAHDSVMSNQLDVPLLPPILAREGRVADAVETARSWARRQAEQGNVQGAARASLALADLLVTLGRSGEALREADTAAALAARVRLGEEAIQAERVRGMALSGAGRLDSALTVLRRAAAAAEARPTADVLLATRLALAGALAQAGRTDEALEAYDRAASGVERTMGRLGHDVDRARYRARQLAAFDGALRLLLAQSPRPRAELVAAWSSRRKAASLALATGVTPEQRNGLGRASEVASWSARLGPEEALIDYLVVDSEATALVMRAGRASVVQLPIRADSVRALVERLRQPLVAAYAGHVDLARAPYDLAAARRLFEVLVGPLEAYLSGARRVFVVPDGPLHQVPFDALVTGGPSGAPGSPAYHNVDYLVDRVEIVTLPSIGFLPSGVGAAIGKRGVLAVGHHAPGVDQELEGVAGAWPAGRVRTLAGDSATESRLRRLAGEYDVLHVATHAKADDREPEASHLRLREDSLHDGYLHLVEIASDLRPRGLVVLSACETVSGRLYQGEGLLGLSRAFLAAGARAVVATHWPVGPASADIMTRLHQGLARGAEPATALRQAKLALRRDPATAHPFYWAGYLLVMGPG